MIPYQHWQPNFNNHLSTSNKFCSFAVADRIAEARSRAMREGRQTYEKAFTRRSFLTLRNLVNFNDSSRMQQTVDVLVDMYIPVKLGA